MNSVTFETAALTVARFSLFFACRKYLLRALYSNLKSLSTTGSLTHTTSRPQSPAFNGNSNDDAPIELESLPPPTTQAVTSSHRVMIQDAAYLHTYVSRTIFSWCFAECCMLFFLLMLQGWGIFSPRTRLINWRFSLLFLICAILFMIPLAFSLLLFLPTSSRNYQSAFTSLRVIVALVTIGLYLFTLSFVPIPTSLKTSDTFIVYISRLLVLGTVILGLLSGFGAITNSWQFLPTRREEPIPSERDLDASQYALTSVRQDFQKRLAEAARREGTSNGGSWISRMGTSFRGGDGLAQELHGLEALEYQMSRKFEALRERYEAAMFGNTVKGKIFNAFGKIFAAYCILRVVSSIYNVVFLPSRRSASTTTYPDLFTKFLSFLFTHLSSSDHRSAHIRYEDLAAVARQFSLLLVGVIILSSIRLALRGVTRVLHITSRNTTASLTLLVLAQIMGIYLLSTLVQMRSSFPPPSSSEETENLFTTIPAYEIFGSLFDWSFLLAAGASAAVKWGMERIN